MDIKPNTSPEHPSRYAVTFTVEETEVVSAAYAEEIHERASKGNSSDGFAATVASWDGDKSRSINVDAELVAGVDGVLKRFHERTQDVITELPEITAVPAFRNKDIGLRQSLGAAAAKLAEELILLVQTEKDVADIRTMTEAKDRPNNRKRGLFH